MTTFNRSFINVAILLNANFSLAKRNSSTEELVSIRDSLEIAIPDFKNEFKENEERILINLLEKLNEEIANRNSREFNNG